MNKTQVTQEELNASLHAVVRFHPGEELADKMEEMNMSISELAQKANIPENIAEAIIAGEASVTADIAVALESVTNIPAYYWLRMQNKYDEYVLTTQEKTTYINKLRLFTHRAASVLL